MGGRCGTVWSVCLCSEACAGRGGARDGAVVGRAASARRIFHDMRASRCRIGAAHVGGPGGGSAGPRRGRLRWSGVESWWNGFLLNGQRPISSIWYIRRMSCAAGARQPERPLGRHVVPARRRERVER